MTSKHGDSHGQTLAAWTAVIIMLIGSTISAFAVIFAAILVFWIGIAVVLAGGIAGLVLRSMGYGQERANLHSGGR